MATVEENLYTLFTGSTAIAAVVGTRVYPVMAPQNATYPCLVYTRVSTPRFHTHDGASGMAQPRFQINLWADSFSAARTLADTVRTAVDGTKTVSGTAGVIRTLRIVDETVLWSGDPADRYMVALDAIINHAE